MDRATAESRRLWATTKLRLYDEPYRLVSLPRSELGAAARLLAGVDAPFVALVMEPAELSLTIPEAVWRAHRSEHPDARTDGPYRAITFDQDLPLTAVGYLAPAAVRLAEAGVSIVPQCGFLKDHLLVREADASHAIAVLEAWIGECRVASA